jgi:hypothetical protein
MLLPPPRFGSSGVGCSFVASASKTATQMHVTDYLTQQKHFSRVVFFAGGWTSAGPARLRLAALAASLASLRSCLAAGDMSLTSSFCAIKRKKSNSANVTREQNLQKEIGWNLGRQQSQSVSELQFGTAQWYYDQSVCQESHNLVGVIILNGIELVNSAGVYYSYTLAELGLYLHSCKRNLIFPVISLAW